MAINSVRFPFTSFRKVDAQYSLVLQGYLTRGEFDQRIRELNKAGRKNRICHFLSIALLVIIVLLVVLSFFFGFSLWFIIVIFFGVISVSSLNYKLRTNQIKAFIKKLNDFNIIYHSRGVNWRIESDKHFDRYSRTIYTQRYLVIEAGTPQEPRVINIPSPPPPAYHESVKNN